MKISVVMAAYNSQATIGEAIESFLAQDHPEKELIVIDGASQDDTRSIVEGFSSPAIRFLSERDKGIYDALNKGIALAEGDVVGLLHTDDLFARKNVLSRVAEALGSGEVDGAYGDLEYVARDRPSSVIRYWRAGAYSRDLLRKGWMPPHPTLFLRSGVFEKHGNYDVSFRISADYEAILRWLTKAELQLAYIPEVLVRMRVGGESNRSLGRIIRKSREDLRAIRRHGIGGCGVLLAKNASKLGQFTSRDGYQDMKDN
ncbi:glycosyltransferase family 2 protein [Maritimibacter sp. DP1N21-5]|uniref:glycosyltransferase family 2 protein n=1 Tax=Maritimibacter sp. DP1N21-5 TaxID=2836867 RepID=UPI001C470E4F|nr:glycosyltransferase family 2 protein [Maritimibacter sp. DP1N21-5]MBV7410708.1 glycosyltransferase [Maritimibacter sp. DP1N21-5]